MRKCLCSSRSDCDSKSVQSKENWQIDEKNIDLLDVHGRCEKCPAERWIRWKMSTVRQRIIDRSIFTCSETFVCISTSSSGWGSIALPMTAENRRRTIHLFVDLFLDVSQDERDDISPSAISPSERQHLFASCHSKSFQKRKFSFVELVKSNFSIRRWSFIGVMLSKRFVGMRKQWISSTALRMIWILGMNGQIPVHNGRNLLSNDIRSCRRTDFAFGQWKLLATLANLPDRPANCQRMFRWSASRRRFSKTKPQMGIATSFVSFSRFAPLKDIDEYWRERTATQFRHLLGNGSAKSLFSSDCRGWGDGRSIIDCQRGTSVMKANESMDEAPLIVVEQWDELVREEISPTKWICIGPAFDRERASISISTRPLMNGVFSSSTLRSTPPAKPFLPEIGFSPPRTSRHVSNTSIIWARSTDRWSVKPSRSVRWHYLVPAHIWANGWMRREGNPSLWTLSIPFWSSFPCRGISLTVHLHLWTSVDMASGVGLSAGVHVVSRSPPCRSSSPMHCQRLGNHGYPFGASTIESLLSAVEQRHSLGQRTTLEKISLQ